jgi:hypothetical protein
MRTKSPETVRSEAVRSPRAATPDLPDTAAYWLEDDLGNRVSKLFSSSDRPLRLAGRVLENVGSLEGWSMVRRDMAGARHLVASGDDLVVMTIPFMPERTLADAEKLRRLNEARRAAGFRRASVVTDEKVY